MNMVRALATDYDGTIAENGRVTLGTLSALEAWRRAGRTLILATGRELEDLRQIFPDIGLFHVVVAENGAVLYWPAEDRVELLAAAANRQLAAELTTRGVRPISVGHSVIATWQPFEHVCLQAIHDLGLELQLVFNKNAVMILPSGVNKASGVRAALGRLEIPPHEVAGIGDAENDHALLELCGVTAAVENAVPALKARAGYVTRGARGAGVEEFVAQLLVSPGPACAQ